MEHLDLPSPFPPIILYELDDFKFLSWLKHLEAVLKLDESKFK